MKQQSSSAVVQLTVEVPVGSWGEDCSLKQVREQATESALRTMTRVCQVEGFKIVGVPSVRTIVSNTN